MKSKDLLQKEKTEILQRMSQAIQQNDESGFAQVFTEFADHLQQSIIGEAMEMKNQYDSAVLTARGVRLLTTEERSYYSEVIQAMRSGDPKQALSGLDVAMPRTVIDAVFEDLKEGTAIQSPLPPERSHPRLRRDGNADAAGGCDF